MVIIAEAAIGRVETENHEFFKNRKFNKNKYFRDGKDGKPVFAKYLKDTFKWGRRTANTCKWNVGRMPNPEHSCEGKGLDENGNQRDGLR